MSALNRIVVVGAGLAGVRSCHELRTAGFTGELVLLGAEPQAPYDRPPLSKAVLLGDPGPAPLLEPEWYAGADLRLGVTATGLAPGVLATTAGELRWDGLVLAVGAVPRRLPGSDRSGCVLRTAADAARLRAALRPGARVVVIGAGWIGAEVATAAARHGCAVTVLEAASAPLAASLGPAAGARTASWYAEAGVDLRTGVVVSTVEAGGVGLATGEQLPADAVVEAIGVRPDLGWLAGSPVAVDPATGGVVTDPAGRTTLPGAVAVGDCAARESPRTGTRVRTEHWDDALRALAAAAAALLGGPRADPAAALLGGRGADPVYDPVPYVWSEQFGRYLQWVGWRGDGPPAVWRGDPTARTGWAAGWLDPAGRLTGLLAVDRPRDIGQARRLIDAGGRPDPARLADPAVPIRAA